MSLVDLQMHTNTRNYSRYIAISKTMKFRKFDLEYIYVKNVEWVFCWKCVDKLIVISTHMRPSNGASGSSRLFPIRFVTDVHTLRYHNTVQLGNIWNELFCYTIIEMWYCWWWDILWDIFSWTSSRIDDLLAVSYPTTVDCGLYIVILRIPNVGTGRFWPLATMKMCRNRWRCYNCGQPVHIRAVV